MNSTAYEPYLKNKNDSTESISFRVTNHKAKRAFSQNALSTLLDHLNLANLLVSSDHKLQEIS